MMSVLHIRRIHLYKKDTVLLVFILIFNTAFAQKVAVKSNLLYDATTTPNLGLELATGKKQTLQLFYGLNPWKFDDKKKLRHWVLQPEYRWWFCQRFNGSFVGVHAHSGEFNMAGVKLPFGIWPELKSHRYEGWFAGGGLTYGYQWVLSKHWNFEASIGAGYAYIKYKKYGCAKCGEKKKDTHRHYVGPTKTALSLIYAF